MNFVRTQGMDWININQIDRLYIDDAGDADCSVRAVKDKEHLGWKEYFLFTGTYDECKDYIEEITGGSENESS